MRYPSVDGDDLTPLAATLQTEQPGIIDTWMQQCRQEVPAARELEALSLQNSVDHLLNALQHVLSASENSAKERQAQFQEARIARFHGEERHAQLVYDLVQMVHEYRLLRIVVFERFFAKHGPLSLQAVATVNQFFDVAVSQAADAFTQMRFDAQSDKFSEERDAAAESVRSVNAEKESAQRDQQQTAAELRQAKNELTQLGETIENKEQFVSFLSHDLRSPLTSIVLTTQLLARRLAGTPNLILVERIARAASKADRMLHDFLDARRDHATGQMMMEFRNCDLSVVLHRLHQDMNQRYGNRFTLESPSTLCGHWDCAAIERALENLCNNAVKYGAPNAPIHLQLVGDREAIAASVNNAGPPISNSDQKRLFKPYYRAPAAGQGAQEGWGLGLAYVTQVAQLHGGKALVSSNLEEGTTFVLKLPRDARLVFSDTSERRTADH